MMLWRAMRMVRRAMRIPSATRVRSSLSSTMPALSVAMPPVLRATAMPTVAAARAGASLVPSPTISVGP